MPFRADSALPRAAPALTHSSEMTRHMAHDVRQQCVDLKAFTGKGNARAVRRAMKAVADIHAEMTKLAQLSILWGKRMLYLANHVRTAYHQHSLRWRGYTVTDGRGVHKHLSWDEAAKRISQQPYEAQIKFHALDAEARRLNDAELAARLELKRLRALTQDR